MNKGRGGLGLSFGASADALHGFCSDCMIDNMIGGVPVTSTTTKPLMDFGFWSGGKTGLSGTYTIDILTLDNGGAPPSGMYSITGGATGTASLFSTTAWTSQSTKLDTYLGISASPQNPLGAWLPATKTLDAAAMGYWVFQANLGMQTLGTSTGTGPMLTLGSALPTGSVIVGFMDTGPGKETATANSSALFEDAGGKGAPEPGTLSLLATAFAALGGVSLLRRRRACAPA